MARLTAFLWVVFIIGKALGQRSLCRCSCPANWVGFGGHCFQYFSAEKDWADAETHCVSLGANLVSVHSEEEFGFINKLIMTNDPNRPVWIGLTDSVKDGRWMWSDGSGVDSAFWNPNEPNGQTRENCVQTNWSCERFWHPPAPADQKPLEFCIKSSPDLTCQKCIDEAHAEKKWNDEACTKKYPFICVLRPQ